MAKAMQQAPNWDLSDLYAGVDDPNLEQDLQGNINKAKSFAGNYKGKLSSESLTASQLKSAMDDYEALYRSVYKPMAFAQLLFSTNTMDAKRGALVQKVSEVSSTVQTHLVFFDIEIGQMPQATFDQVMQADELQPYRHYLQKVRDQAKHNLTEPEEKILVETANSRGPAFSRLFTEISSRATFTIEKDGEEQTLNQSEVLAMLYDPDRDVRRKAAESVTDGVKQNAHAVTFIYNTLIHEKSVLDRLRGLEHPESSRHLDNEIDLNTVNTMVDVCADNFNLVQDYYLLKKKLLGLDELTHYDRYAPIESKQQDIPFDEARDIVMTSFNSFSPKLAEMTEPFFSKNWIDAAVADGKRGGAFCAGITPDLHPYVFMNYTNTANDVMTLAHELGHGLHDVLASNNHMLDYQPVLPMAETASTFGEMLVFDKLLSGLDSEEEKLGLICKKIEDTFATVFRQISMFRFERQAHQLRREKGEQPTEAFSELWQSSQQEMFGDSLKLGEDHACWWLYVPHIIQVPFYVYAYAFGELLVMSLYAQYQREGDSFIDKYFNLLAAGGSQSPAQLVSEMGFNIADASFWQSGCDLVREQIQRAKALAR